MEIIVKEKVLKIISGISGKSTNNVNLNADLKNQIALDSIQIVELFALLEKEFEIELPLKMMTVKTGKEFLEILEKQLTKNQIGIHLAAHTLTGNWPLFRTGRSECFGNM